MRLFFNISGANLTKIFDLRVTNMLKMQFYTENMLYIRLFFAQFSRFKERLIYRHLHRVSGMIKEHGGIDPVTFDM